MLTATKDVAIRRLIVTPAPEGMDQALPSRKKERPLMNRQQGFNAKSLNLHSTMRSEAAEQMRRQPTGHPAVVLATLQSNGGVSAPAEPGAS